MINIYLGVKCRGLVLQVSNSLLKKKMYGHFWPITRFIFLI